MRARIRGWPRRSKIVLGIGLSLVLLAGAALGTAAYLAHRYGKALTWENLLSPGSRRTNGNGRISLTGPLNYLLVGSDLRVDDPDSGQRSDTIIIVHIPAGLDRAYLVSIPRDLYVDLPAMPEYGVAAGPDKINAAFGYGGGNRAVGVQVLAQTLTNLTGVTFDGAAVIDFNGFQNALGVLGGVTLCVDTETTSIHTGAVYEPGCQRMRPWQALDYVRQRYDQPDGDYGRQRHQQQLLKAIFSEALDKGFGNNPIKLDKLIRAVGSALTVDLNGDSLTTVLYTLRNLRPDDLTGVRVPSHIEAIDNTSYVVADTESISLYLALRYDTLDRWVAADPAWVNEL